MTPVPYYYPTMWELIQRALPIPLQVVVEIGTQFGHWAEGCLRYLRPEKLFCIDPWSIDSEGRPTRSGPKSDLSFLRWQRRCGEALYDTVIPLRGRSQGWAAVFPFAIDLLYIDGDHSRRGALRDLQLWIPKVRRGGLVLVHDMDNKGVQRAAREFFGDEFHTIRQARLGPKQVPTLWVMIQDQPWSRGPVIAPGGTSDTLSRP